MMPTAELLVVETTRSAPCPKQLKTKRSRRKRKGFAFVSACLQVYELVLASGPNPLDPPDELSKSTTEAGPPEE